MQILAQTVSKYTHFFSITQTLLLSHSEEGRPGKARGQQSRAAGLTASGLRTERVRNEWIWAVIYPLNQSLRQTEQLYFIACN